VSLAAEDVAATRRLLLEQDVVYVGGGDPQLLLDRWRQHDVEATLAEAHRRGVVLAGTSAGAMCWFEHVVDEERDEVVPGLRLLPGAFVPHASTAPRHVAVATRALERGQLGVAWFVDEWAALHFVGRDLARVIADPGDAGVAEVRPTAGGVETRRLAATTLDGTT
jgi:peptidase E